MDYDSIMISAEGLDSQEISTQARTTDEAEPIVAKTYDTPFPLRRATGV